jgi:hypothetical protein
MGVAAAATLVRNAPDRQATCEPPHEKNQTGFGEAASFCLALFVAG